MYPVGTKCVITWVGDGVGAVANLGEVVVCLEDTFNSRDHSRLIKDGVPSGMVCQEIDIPMPGALGEVAVHPVDWMRPLEDPDTSIMDDAEDIKHLSDEILS